MSTPEPPTTQAPQPQPPPRRRRFRFTRFGVLLALGALAVLVVGGVVGALAFPRSAAADVPGRAAVGHGAPGRGGPEGGHGGGKARGPEGGPGRGGARGPGGAMAGPAVAGVVVSVADGTLVVTPDGAAQRTLKTDANTRVEGPNAPALTGLKAGQRVLVRVSGTGADALATTVRVVQARVTGTVTAVNGTAATVVSYEGLTVQVDVSGLTQKPVVGDVVELTGTASGATLKAAEIKELPKAS